MKVKKRGTKVSLFDQNLLCIIKLMRRVYLIHGWEGYPEEGWRPWLRNKLIQEGFQVFVPAMPDTAHPSLERWLPHLQKVVKKPDLDTFFVGHSLGCITILRYLEALGKDQHVGGTVLVAGFGHDLEYEGYENELASFFKKEINWEKIKNQCSRFVAIHSDNDPWVPMKHNNLFVEKLNAESLIEHNKLHFSGDDGINELPSALDSVLRISNQRI
jgi:predicted alpha/beta hydrolase family esterase